MGSEALVSLQGRTTQIDFGVWVYFKAGFFFVQWIHLALALASAQEPLAGWVALTQAFQPNGFELCSILPVEAQGLDQQMLLWKGTSPVVQPGASSPSEAPSSHTLCSLPAVPQH